MKSMFSLLSVSALSAFVLLALPGCFSGSTEPEVVELSVMPYLQPCHGFIPKSCLVAKESDKDSTYGPFYDAIEGFTFEWGYRYVLQVEVHPIKDPPEDTPEARYVLVGDPVRGAEPHWIMDLYLAYHHWSLRGDTLEIPYYAKRILVQDAADRDSLQAWKGETYLRLLVEPGEGDFLAGSQVRR